MKNLLLRIFFPDLFCRVDLKPAGKTGAQLLKEKAEADRDIAKAEHETEYWKKMKIAVQNAPQEVFEYSAKIKMAAGSDEDTEDAEKKSF